MKIQFASDLHLTLLEASFPDYRVIEYADADVLVLAGDIHRAARAIEVFRDWPVPVVYVHGNHELYHEQFPEVVDNMRAASAGSNVHVLEQDVLVLNGTRFLGCCLWTDYLLAPDAQQAAMGEAGEKLRDHSVIRTAQGLFTPQDALKVHQQSRAWLQTKLEEPFDGPTVVVTHHAPHPGSVHPRYAGIQLNAAFVSNLADLVRKADVWIHGHVHDCFDYMVGDTHVVANPRGYALNRRDAKTPEEIVWENDAFDPRRVIEI